jgi:hypothetical protein
MAISTVLLYLLNITPPEETWFFNVAGLTRGTVFL